MNIIEIHIKGMEEFKKKFSIVENEDFIEIYKKPFSEHDEPIARYTKFVDMEEMKEYLKKL